MKTPIPRPEYPRPQFVRKDWLCLNGPWEFEIDGGDSGLERGLLGRRLEGRIVVPFCPESELSGVGCRDFMAAVWYRRAVTPPKAWRGRRVLLHFGTVDYDATVWVDGREAGRHRGGFTPFTCDLGDVGGEELTIVVRARDDHRPVQPRGKQSQRYENYGCMYTRTTGIWQTVWMEPVPATHLRRPRLTPDVAAGAIWVEQPICRAGISVPPMPPLAGPVPAMPSSAVAGAPRGAAAGAGAGAAAMSLSADPRALRALSAGGGTGGTMADTTPQAALRGKRGAAAMSRLAASSALRADSAGGGAGGTMAGMTLRAVLRDNRGVVARATAAADADFSPRMALQIPKSRRRLWSPEDPHLYGLEIELLDAGGKVVDRLESYAGLRGVSIDGAAVKLNGKAVFQRLVLDQGYYPDGILTAPTDAALARDIELAQAAGFNGARLHQKVFEERFLYHADRLGYLVWGEFADWGANVHGDPGDTIQPTPAYIAQWLEALHRDYSHPSIVGWCPLNETAQLLHDRITTLDDATTAMFLAAKAADGTRPVLDASGYSHRIADIDVYDSHDYTQDAAEFARRHAGLAEGKPFVNAGKGAAPWSLPWRGQPYFVSEFGGIWWNPNAKPGEASWGYGQRPATLEEFYARFEGLCKALLNDPRMFGYCYTQLTDVYQEQNGIYTFERGRKFDMKRIAAAQRRRAGIEGGK